MISHFSYIWFIFLQLVNYQSYHSAKLHHEYAVVIDCGSTGSRIFIYRWITIPSSIILSSTDHTRHLPKYELFGVKKKEPGVSYVAEKGSTVLYIYLKSLKELITKMLPSNIRENRVQFYLLATAGVRLLPKKLQETTIENIRSYFYLNANYQFLKEDVDVIDGKDEALYQWLALNYLVNRLKINNAIESLSMIDLGGGSVQTAYLPTNISNNNKFRLDRKNQLNLKTYNGFGIQKMYDNYQIFLHELMNKIVKKYLYKSIYNSVKSIIVRIDDIQLKINNSHHLILEDPCLNRGMSEDIKFLSDNKSYEQNGIGNFETCRKLVKTFLTNLNRISVAHNEFSKIELSLEKLLEKKLFLQLKLKGLRNNKCEMIDVSEPCEVEPFQQFNYQQQHIYGFAELYYSMNDRLSIGEEYSSIRFRKQSEKWCDRTWKELKILPFQTDQLKRQCFKSSYIHSLLHDLLNIPLNYHHLHSTQTIKDMEISWTLGALIARNNQTHSSKQHYTLVSMDRMYFNHLIMVVIFLLVVFLIIIFKGKRRTLCNNFLRHNQWYKLNNNSNNNGRYGTSVNRRQF
ncbi:hypothetical protein SNEBB_000873 [Seison nebaliae]|nr:hypothetical protein SNEBB_000873 [Seison nebaliae]